MSHTQHYLDALKAHNGGVSDYRAAQILDVTRAAVSKWRNKTCYMSASTAEKVAEAIGADPDIVILETQLDRCKDPIEHAAWERILKRLSSPAKALITTCFLLSALSPTPAEAAPITQAKEPLIYILDFGGGNCPIRSRHGSLFASPSPMAKRIACEM